MWSTKRYTKPENWFFQMQLKLEEEIVRNIKKKKKSNQLMHVKSSYDILNLWKWNSYFWENELHAVAAAKKFHKKINYFSYFKWIELKFGYDLVGVCSNTLWFFRNFSFATSLIIELEKSKWIKLNIMVGFIFHFFNGIDILLAPVFKGLSCFYTMLNS